MHEPVLVKEVVDLMAVRQAGHYIDGTVGSGGHAAAIMEQAGHGGFLLALDRDVDALARAREKLAPWADRCAFEEGSFVEMRGAAREHGLDQVDGILLDLGVSSEQLDTPERGFSFTHDGPLDMRMGRSAPRTAADLVNELSEPELADLIATLGEEPRARRIAHAIVRERAKEPFRRTARLAGVVGRAAGGRRGPRHPATRTFQALRMAVNTELEALERVLPEALDLLRDGGRLAVISFHSLEDRTVKVFFRRHAGRWESLAAGGEEWRGELPPLRLITRKVVRPGEAERDANPRARSARLRVAERTRKPER